MESLSLVVALLLLATCGHCYDCNHGHSGPPQVPSARPLPRRRPAAANRTFTSKVVDAELEKLMLKKWRDPELATLLWNCLPNTLDTTVWQSPTKEDGRSFISTGDIAAMWLRDSQNQVLPYIRFAKAEPEGIGMLIKGLIKRHVESVLMDPYANSFSFSPADIECNINAWTLDNTTMLDPATGKRESAMTVGVHQRKWEMDSLSSVMKVGRLYYDATDDPTPFDAEWLHAVETIVKTYRQMQQPLTPDNFTTVNYTFQTLTHEPKDTSAHGIGRSHRWTGMVRTSFLPSDDSPRLPYHIPGNAFAVVELKGVAAMLRKLPETDAFTTTAAHALADKAVTLADEIHAAIQRWGVIFHPQTGKRAYAMEVDGYGNSFFGDDANPPSLLSLPFLGYLNASDPIYKATRELLLSNETNPYFYGSGDIVNGGLGGIGSEDASGNAGLGHVWGLSLVIRLLTIEGHDDAAEAEAVATLKALVESSGGTGLMHESFWYTDPTVYTRYWFAMANSYLGEAVLSLVETHPSWLFKE